MDQSLLLLTRPLHSLYIPTIRATDSERGGAPVCCQTALNGLVDLMVNSCSPCGKDYDVHDLRDDRDTILTNEIHHTDTRTVGVERVALNTLHLLGVYPDPTNLQIQQGSDPLGHRTSRVTDAFS